MIYFRCDAGPIVVLGHIVRSSILGKKFYDLTKSKPTFITNSSEKITSKYINKNYFNLIYSNSKIGTDKDSDFVSSIIEDDCIIIADSRFIRQKDINFWSKDTFLVGIDDGFNNLRWPLKLNYNLYEEKNKNNVNDLIGPEYNLINDNFFIGSQIFKESTPKVLITLGGEDPNNLTGWIIDNCSEILRDFEVRIVLGASHPEISRVKLHASKLMPNAEIIENALNLIEHAIWSNIAITAGGMTAYELAVSGNALIGVAIEKHQIPLINSMKKAGAMEVLGTSDSIKSEDLIETLRKLINDPIKANNLRVSAMGLFPKSGARFAASRIL